MDCPAYGLYCPTSNPFGVGFYHGWSTGEHVSPREADAYFRRLGIEVTPERVKSYLNGRDDGVARNARLTAPA